MVQEVEEVLEIVEAEEVVDVAGHRNEEVDHPAPVDPLKDQDLINRLRSLQTATQLNRPGNHYFYI